ncbi:MAG: ribonuclease [Clostridia bacterium]|nr:ribonuclease [Clostridia bacterium]
MRKFSKILLLLLSAVIAITSFTACDGIGEIFDSLGELAEIAYDSLEDANSDLTVSDPSEDIFNDSDIAEIESSLVSEDGIYTSKEDVALYIRTYGKLPDNFITKDEARSLGWEGGGLDGYADGKCIGGDYFGNYEGLLPKKDGRTYTECDIDTLGKSSRGAKRIVFSNDGLIYYTDDHYETFELLYGEE